MKKLLCSLFGLSLVCVALPAFAAGNFSCGAGYVLADHAKVDGINTKQCVKLWCRDLETNKAMGNGDRVASGYIDVLSETSDGRDSVPCFGDRKWCAGEAAGVWVPEYGVYVRGSDDGSTYKAYQKSGCFAWRLEKPECDTGESAILRNGEWVCVTASNGDISNIQKSSVRRTGNIRRIMR